MYNEYELKLIEWLKTFKSRQELKNFSEKVYCGIIRSNSFSLLLDLAIPITQKVWTLESCKLDALNYQTRNEWSVNSSAYQAAVKQGWLNECCQHMKYVLESWTFEKCKEDALKFKSRSEWSKNSNNAYSASRRNKWLEECCDHMNKNLIKCSNGKVYNSLVDISKQLNLQESNVHKVLSGKRKSTGGYTFVYVEEEND